MSATLYDVIAANESSGGQNVWGPQTSSGQAEGWYQITTGTWNEFAPQAGVDLSQYPTPNAAPQGVQELVASVIPLDRWAPSTVSAAENAFGPLNTAEPLGQISENLSGSATPASALQGATGGIGQATGAPSSNDGSGGSWLSGLANWVERGFLIVVAAMVIAVALWWILAEAGAVPSPKTAVKALAA